MSNPNCNHHAERALSAGVGDDLFALCSAEVERSPTDAVATASQGVGSTQAFGESRKSDPNSNAVHGRSGALSEGAENQTRVSTGRQAADRTALLPSALSQSPIEQIGQISDFRATKGEGDHPPLCIGDRSSFDTLEIGPGGSAEVDNGAFEGVTPDGISVRDGLKPSDTPSKRTRPFTRYAQRKTVPAAFRALVLESHPELKGKLRYLRLFGALLSPRRAAATRDGRPAVVLKGSMLAACMGREVEYRNGDLIGDAATGPFLDAFNSDVFGGALEIEDRDRDGESKRARCVSVESVRKAINPDVLSAWESLPPASETTDRVYLDTGARLSANSRRRERARVESVLKGTEREAHCPLAARVARYMNGLPARTFGGLDYAAARAVASTLTNANTARRQVDLLRAIEDQPKPYYGFSRWSPRVWGMGQGITGLKSEVRRALMPDAVEMDLAAAHFAIAARDWGLTDLHDFLSLGASLWPELLPSVGLAADSALKGVVKPGGYGLVYGAGERRIVTDVREAYEALTGAEMHADNAAGLLRHPLMQEALEGRKRELELIRERIGARGFIPDCFGVPIHRGRRGYGSKDRRDYARSILAQLNQAREIWLMEPVLRLAEEEAKRDRPAWRIVLWLHDGVSVHFTRDRDRHQRRIVAAVAERARKGGYPTRLEVS